MLRKGEYLEVRAGGLEVTVLGDEFHCVLNFHAES
jgi:hypothetical protein